MLPGPKRPVPLPPDSLVRRGNGTENEAQNNDNYASRKGEQWARIIKLAVSGNLIYSLSSSKARDQCGAQFAHQ